MKVQQQIDRATSIMRAEALKNSEKKNIDRVPLVVTYHPDLPNLSKILRQHLPILHVSERMKRIVPNAPLVAKSKSSQSTRSFSASINEAPYATTWRKQPMWKTTLQDLFAHKNRRQVFQRSDRRAFCRENNCYMQDKQCSIFN